MDVTVYQFIGRCLIRLDPANPNIPASINNAGTSVYFQQGRVKEWQVFLVLKNKRCFLKRSFTVIRVGTSVRL